jgi:hypothetical protein
MNTRNSITSQDEKLVNMQMSIGYKSGLQKQLKMVYMTITNNCCPIQRVIRGLSRMKGNFHVRFLEEVATRSHITNCRICYPLHLGQSYCNMRR